MQIYERQTFPLVPQRQLTRLPFGETPSRRRGHGSDVIGHRAYEQGDPVSAIDWRTSARLSAASGQDEFIVRERATDEAPRVVIVADRRPAMSLYPPPLPWISKRDALAEATLAIAASAAAARADIATLDFADGDAHWLPPARLGRLPLVSERLLEAPFAAPEDTLERSLDFLTLHALALPAGSYIFLLSDFLAPPSARAWRDAIRRDWDVVPVVIQDPVWEQSFPAVGGVAVPLADPRSGPVGLVRLSRREAAQRRQEQEARHASLLAQLESLGFPPVELAASDSEEVDRSFLAWAELRRWRR